MLPYLVAVAFFMESLDTTILNNTALPAMASALHVAPLSMKSVLTSYTLSLAVFIPVSGWVADRFGTRIVFASAIGLFTLGSVLCGVSSDLHLLVACRILQGCGGAMMVPVGRLTMVHAFPKSELVRAMSFVAVPALIGPMLGPLVGGLIVDFLHWRMIFFVNLPIGLLGLFLVYRHLPDYRASHTPPLDWTGLVLFGGGVGLLSYVLEVFGEHTLGVLEVSAAGAARRGAFGGLRRARDSFASPAAAPGLAADSHLARGVERQLRHAPGHRRHAVPAAASVSSRAGLHAHSIRPADLSTVAGCADDEDEHAQDPDAFWLPPRAGHQHRAARPVDRRVRNRDSTHAPCG